MFNQSGQSEILQAGYFGKTFQFLGDGFQYLLFSPRFVGRCSNLTCAYFFKWLGSTTKLAKQKFQLPLSFRPRTWAIYIYITPTILYSFGLLRQFTIGFICRKEPPVLYVETPSIHTTFGVRHFASNLRLPTYLANSWRWGLNPPVLEVNVGKTHRKCLGLLHG